MAINAAVVLAVMGAVTGTIGLALGVWALAQGRRRNRSGVTSLEVTVPRSWKPWSPCCGTPPVISEIKVLCKCVRFVDGSWADAGPDRTIPHDSDERWSAEKNCAYCCGSGWVPYLGAALEGERK